MHAAPAPSMPGAEPFSAGGDGPNARTGVLVLHGFTGSPQSMRPWAERLAEEGFAVELPRLPGHGTRWQDLAGTTWDQWFAAAAEALAGLASRCDRVFVAGLSMGGTLALRLAEERPVAGVVTVNPALVSTDPRLRLLPIMKLVVPSVPGIGSDIKKPGVTEGAYDRVPLRALAQLLELQKVTLAGLPAITAPVLTFRSREDHVVPARSGELLLKGVRPGVASEVVLTESYHVATLDNDADTIFEGSVAFIRAQSGARATPGATT